MLPQFVTGLGSPWVRMHWWPLGDCSYPSLSPWEVTWVRLAYWDGRETWLWMECMVSRGKTSLGQNKEAPEQDAGRAGLMDCSALAAPKCPLFHACPCLTALCIPCQLQNSVCLLFCLISGLRRWNLLMALVAARIIPFHVKELGGIQSMLCPWSTCGWDCSTEAAGKWMCQESWCKDTSQRVSSSYKIVLWACRH